VTLDRNLGFDRSQVKFQQLDCNNARFWRVLTQWLFFGLCLFLGVQFGLFVRHFETMGRTGYFPRPPGIEGFLPIGALMSFKAWLLTGQVDPVHPAALVLFLTFLCMALLAKKSFCSFLCPVGTVSEGAWKIGRKLFGRNFRVWSGLDFTLQLVKYAVLFFFIKLIIFTMPLTAIKDFLSAPYWAIADVKLLYFFVNMTRTSLLVIVFLLCMSLIYKNFWCRYLCPYGALLGLLSMLSPFKVKRNVQACTNCRACSRSCPSLIDVQRKVQVRSPECTGCLTCVNRCPEPGALAIAFWSRPVRPKLFVLWVLGLFTSGVLFGMVTGNWQTSLIYTDYQLLIPLAMNLAG
jgi:polyferredoxin